MGRADGLDTQAGVEAAALGWNPFCSGKALFFALQAFSGTGEAHSHVMENSLLC